MSNTAIPQEELEEAYRKTVRDACQSLANVCYSRIMADPNNGIRYLSELAIRLDCQLDFKIENTVPADEATK